MILGVALFGTITIVADALADQEGWERTRWAKAKEALMFGPLVFLIQVVLCTLVVMVFGWPLHTARILEIADFPLHHWWSKLLAAIVILTIGYSLHLLKSRILLLYASLELSGGVLLGWHAVGETKVDSLALVFALMGAVFLVSRGLENFRNWKQRDGTFERCGTSQEGFDAALDNIILSKGVGWTKRNDIEVEVLQSTVRYRAKGGKEYRVKARGRFL